MCDREPNCLYVAQCPGEWCWMCNGHACLLCDIDGNRPAREGYECEHDVIDRHRTPERHV